MTVITTYIADDGTEFDNEWECQNYEAKQEAKKYEHTVFFLDEDGNRLPFSTDSFDGAFFIKVVTDEAAEFVAERFGRWNTPWTNIEPRAGIWTFYNEVWVPIEIIEEKCKRIREIL